VYRSVDGGLRPLRVDGSWQEPETDEEQYNPSQSPRLPEETQGDEPAQLDTIPIMLAKFLQDATTQDDRANHAGRDRLSADILGPGLGQVNVMRCHPNEVPECFLFERSILPTQDICVLFCCK
jgi:hypothetical protein